MTLTKHQLPLWLCLKPWTRHQRELIPMDDGSMKKCGNWGQSVPFTWGSSTWCTLECFLGSFLNSYEEMTDQIVCLSAVFLRLLFLGKRTCRIFLGYPDASDVLAFPQGFARLPLIFGEIPSRPPSPAWRGKEGMVCQDPPGVDETSHLSQ